MKITSSHIDSPYFIARNAKSGFTLLEMVIVLGIIAMIMGGAIFTMRNISDSGALTVVDGGFSALENGLQSYRNTAGHYPSQQQGLQALVEKPTTEPRPRRWTNILSEVPQDPWNQEYIYKFPGTKNPSRPEIISLGKDGLADTEDDLSSQDE